MVCKIVLTSRAVRDFSCLEAVTRKRVAAAIDRLEDLSPNASLNVKKLKTPFDGFRMRVGDYRILFVRNKQRIVIYSIQHRKDAYK